MSAHNFFYKYLLEVIIERKKNTVNEIHVFLQMSICFYVKR
jgi:hypothetical protein